MISRFFSPHFHQSVLTVGDLRVQNPSTKLSQLLKPEYHSSVSVLLIMLTKIAFLKHFIGFRGSFDKVETQFEANSMLPKACHCNGQQ